MSVTTEYSKLSVSLPKPLIEGIRHRVGARGVSRYIAEALEHEERRRALRDWLAGQELEHGPVPEEILSEVRRQWLGEDHAGG